MYARAAALLAAVAAVDARRPSEFKRFRTKDGSQPGMGEQLPHQYVELSKLPNNFSWCEQDGKTFCSPVRQQHIPQYCGSCSAFASLGALTDRMRIQAGGRGARGNLQLSIQHLLNCGGNSAGSCYGGDHHAVYEWLHSGHHVSYDSNQNYIACSSDSKEGFCGHVDTTCKAINIARVCDTFVENGGACVGLKHYPNASVASWGSVSGEKSMMAEISARGPIACGIDASPLDKYHGGIVEYNVNYSPSIDHVIVLVGWGVRKNKHGQEVKYWIGRNSWGESWGQWGYFEIERGKNAYLVESDCAWAVPQGPSHRRSTGGEEGGFFCGENGSECVEKDHGGDCNEHGCGNPRDPLADVSTLEPTEETVEPAPLGAAPAVTSADAAAAAAAGASSLVPPASAYVQPQERF